MLKITLNGKMEEIAAQRLGDLLHAKNIDAAKGGVAVAVNGKVVPRANWTQTEIQANDSIEIIAAIGGG